MTDNHTYALIKTAIAKLRSTTIIIDGIDECLDPEETTSSIFRIVAPGHLKETAKIRVLITSQNKIQPLERAFRGKEFVRILDFNEKRDEIRTEIDAYVDARLADMISKGNSNITIEPEFAAEISSSIKESSSSM
jgi:hypothetical protein